MQGFRHAFLLSAALAACGALVSLLRGPRPTAATAAPAAAPGDD